MLSSATVSLPTLDQFITNGRYPSNSYVYADGFESLYVRYTKRVIDGVVLFPVLDLANASIVEDKRGTGIGTKLIKDLRKKYPRLHLYVENVSNERLCKHLLKLGFTQKIQTSGENWTPSFILKAF